MRTASDFDRAPPGVDEVYHLLFADQEGLLPSIENIYLVGIEIVKVIRMYWEETVSDILGVLIPLCRSS
jgi:purine nucleoside permease